MMSRAPVAAHWHSIDILNSGLLVPQVVGTSALAWATANLARYQPVIVQRRSVVKQLWFASSSTATGNYDIGLYDAGGTALLRRGSTAKPTGKEEVWDCTDTTIGPGLYYLALVSSNGTDTFVGVSTVAPLPGAIGVLTEGSALPLPATATFAVDQTNAIYPIVGMFLDTRVT